MKLIFNVNFVLMERNEWKCCRIFAVACNVASSPEAAAVPLDLD